MEAREAIHAAKKWINEVLSEEQITNIGLEEISYDDNYNHWLITLGFSRPWDTTKNVMTALGAQSVNRSFKIIRLDDRNGNVINMTNRNPESPNG